jgi:putative ABC transport system permease protein
MAQSFRERIPEFAILKTLGFSDVAVMLMVLAEALLVCGIGGLLGLLLAKAATEAMATALAATLPGLVMSWNVLGLGLLLVAGLGLVTGLVPALQGLRLNIINALRRN